MFNLKLQVYDPDGELKDERLIKNAINVSNSTQFFGSSSSRELLIGDDNTPQAQPTGLVGTELYSDNVSVTFDDASEAYVYTHEVANLNLSVAELLLGASSSQFYARAIVDPVINLTDLDILKVEWSIGMNLPQHDTIYTFPGIRPDGSDADGKVYFGDNDNPYQAFRNRQGVYNMVAGDAFGHDFNIFAVEWDLATISGKGDDSLYDDQDLYVNSPGITMSDEYVDGDHFRFRLEALFEYSSEGDRNVKSLCILDDDYRADSILLLIEFVNPIIIPQYNDWSVEIGLSIKRPI